MCSFTSGIYTSGEGPVKADVFFTVYIVHNLDMSLFCSGKEFGCVGVCLVFKYLREISALELQK